MKLDGRILADFSEFIAIPNRCPTLGIKSLYGDVRRYFDYVGRLDRLLTHEIGTWVDGTHDGWHIVFPASSN
jgi:hypothetical protein